MIIKCAWCGQEFGNKDGDGQTDTICQPCKAGQLALIGRMEKEPDPPTIEELSKRKRDNAAP